MSEGDGLDAFPTVVDQSVNMQWDLFEVILGANSWIGFAACCGCLLCLPAVAACCAFLADAFHASLHLGGVHILKVES